MNAPQAPDRFNETAAVYTIKGSDAPDLDAGIAAIRNVVRTLPLAPGVYRMTDARGDVLYVGKARSLKNRVSNAQTIRRNLRSALQWPVYGETGSGFRGGAGNFPRSGSSPAPSRPL